MFYTKNHNTNLKSGNVFINYNKQYIHLTNSDILCEQKSLCPVKSLEPIKKSYSRNKQLILEEARRYGNTNVQ